MKTTLFYFFIICINCTFSANSQMHYDNPISGEKLKEDVNILQKNLYEVHPGLFTYHEKEKFDVFFNELNTEINDSLSAVGFYRKLLPLLTLIANNHTKIECPLSYENALINELPKIPFRVYPQKGKLFMHQDLSDEQLIPPGSEILSINGITSREIIKEMIRLDTKDGFNISHSIYAIGVVFSKRYSYYFGTNETYEITYIDKDGSQKKGTIKGIKASILNRRRLKSHSSPIKKNEPTFKIEEEIAYLKIPSFLPRSATAFKKSLKTVFNTLHSRKIQSLIIDVRGNGGGYGEAVSFLFSYLIEKSIFPYKDEYALVDEIPQPQYYEKDMFFKHFKKQPLVKRGKYYHIKNIASKKINPKTPIFKNDIYILLDAASASATGEFLGLAKSHTDAIFIGQESGGNPAETTANDLLHMTLPNSKVRVTIPALRSVGNVSFKNEGRGLIPDYEIIPTIDDILANIDVVLEFTHQKIRSNQEKKSNRLP